MTMLKEKGIVQSGEHRLHSFELSKNSRKLTLHQLSIVLNEKKVYVKI